MSSVNAEGLGNRCNSAMIRCCRADGANICSKLGRLLICTDGEPGALTTGNRSMKSRYIPAIGVCFIQKALGVIQGRTVLQDVITRDQQQTASAAQLAAKPC